MSQKRRSKTALGFGTSSGIFASLFLIAACLAEPLTLEVISAQAGSDQRTSKPILTIRLTGVSKQALYYFSINNIARKTDLRINGRTVISSVIREPLVGGVFQISGDDLTPEKIQGLVEELSKPGIQVEIDTVLE